MTYEKPKDRMSYFRCKSNAKRGRAERNGQSRIAGAFSKIQFKIFGFRTFDIYP